MTVVEKVSPPAELPEVRWMLAQLQRQALQLVLPPLVICGLAFLAYPWRFRDPARGEWLGLAMWLGVLAVWALSRLSACAAGWALSLGCVALELAVLSWAGLAPAVYLLALPPALCAITVGAAAGAGLAVVCTALLLWAPAGLLPADAVQRVVILVGMWSTLGLILLTLQPLLTALQWSWSSYEHGRRLLDRSRDYHVQLKQTLKDLADANLQLTRLNRLAQGLRKAAEDARAAKERFVANVSHELRTPLNMIVGFSEMISQNSEAYGERIPPALLADLEVILRNSQHLSGLIDDVLDLSQIEARRMALTRERVGLAEIVEGAAIAVRPLYDSRGLYLRTQVPAGLTVYCDRTRIREVVLNLLSNAGRFTERGGVEVRATREGPDVVVSVADTGPGIAGEDRERLFQPFEQLDSSVRRRHGGTGLGLAISRSFVELHGGAMWLESEKGSGTTFYFRLPMDPPSPAEGSVTRWLAEGWEYEGRTRPSAAPAPVVRPRLVVLDPAGSLYRLVGRYLHGVEIAAASSLGEATEELSRVPSQALLVNDPSVAQALQRLSTSADLPPGIPAIICSIPGVPEAADALGVSGYLVKPISTENLLGTLGRLDVHGGKVLIVDDEPEAVRLFWRMLANAGEDFTVLTASNGEEALSILRSEPPDVILLDLVMPGMDGFRLLEVREEDPALRGIPVVVISARDPAGQPILSSALAVTQGSGLTGHEVLACIEAIRRALAPGGEPADREPPTDPRV